MKLTWRVIEQSGANILTANYKGVVASTKLAMPERWRTMPSKFLQLLLELCQNWWSTISHVMHEARSLSYTYIRTLFWLFLSTRFEFPRY